jgi:hypothetical protein
MICSLAWRAGSSWIGAVSEMFVCVAYLLLVAHTYVANPRGVRYTSPRGRLLACILVISCPLLGAKIGVLSIDYERGIIC